MVDAEAEWFPLEVLFERSDSGFVSQVRTNAPSLLRRYVDGSRTAAYRLAGDLVVVDVPDLWIRKEQVTLEVLWQGGVLEGQWSDGHYLWDGPLGGGRGLLVSEAVNAEAAAVLTVKWLHDQLARPLVHEAWTRNDVTAAERWTFADTGELLAEIGRSSVFSQPATSTARVRP